MANNNNKEITLLGTTNFRGNPVQFGITQQDRLYHCYIIGKAGSGKSTLMENMCYSDIIKGRGVGLIDPHGEFAEKLLDYIPRDRIKDVVYINPSDIDWPVAFNIIEEVSPEMRHIVKSGLMSVFKKIWPDVWSARMEYILSNTILALLEYPGATLLSINRMLSDKHYRKTVLNHVTDAVVKSFWYSEFDKYNEKFQTEAIAPIQNKVGQFISNPLIRNIIGQVDTKIDMRKIMDEKKILIVNLSKGLTGEENSALLGALIITKIQLAAMSRADVSTETRDPFYLYIDEFQTFSTESFANILSEARKYKLNLILAHQYINQLDDTVKDAVFGNVGNLISFRIGIEDALFLEKEFEPEIHAQDLINLPSYYFYIKMMIDNMPARPFMARELGPLAPSKETFRTEIIDNCHNLYSTPRENVEEYIKKWSALEFVPSNNKPTPRSQTEYWQATCSRCGTKTLVPFQPDPTRPIYCEKCFTWLKTQQQNTQPSISTLQNNNSNFNTNNNILLSNQQNISNSQNITKESKNITKESNKENKSIHTKSKPSPDTTGLKHLLKNLFNK